MGLRVVRLVEVDAQRDGDVRVLGRRRDDHFARAGFEMLRGIGTGAEPSGRLDHDIDAEVAPGQRGGIRDRRRFDASTVDDQRAFGRFDDTRERAVDGVVTQQVGEHLRVGDVIDRHPFDLRLTLMGRAEHRATRPAEAVDRNTNAHDVLLSFSPSRAGRTITTGQTAWWTHC